MDYCEAFDHLKMQTLKERRQKHCVELITKLSSPQHRLHHLLPKRVGEIRQRETGSNVDKFYNFKYTTERFKNSPLVYVI